MVGKRRFEEDEDVTVGDVKTEIKAEGGESSSKKAKKERVNTTVFVSSLPYETTTTDLITHFSFVGPVKNGFVVKDRESGESKGVGYITYTEVADAEKAVADLNNGSFGASTRKIRVSLADVKPTRLERSRVPAAESTQEDADLPSFPGFISVSTPAVRTKPVQPRGQPVKKSTDSNAIRTLVLSGIPADVDKSTLWKRVRKVDGIDGGVQEGLKYPIEIEVGEGEEVKETLGKTAHIIFTSHGKATDAITKLHAHTYKGVLLSCVLKKRIESIPGAGGDTSGKANRAGRLIIRNLAWNTTESDLRSLFLPYGPILGINLPTSASKLPHKDPSKPAPPPRARGFAFVWFLSKKDAEKAIEELNEKEVKERKISVDWAVAKDKYEEKKKEDGDSDDKAAVEAVLATEGDETVKEQEEDAEDEAEEEDEDEEDEEEKIEEEEEEIKPVKPVLPAVEEGSTLFIRNLPFETTEEELRNLFRPHGPLRYAKITMDRETGRSRGTGFACFWKREDADKVLNESNRVKEITGANMIDLAPKNPFALPSVLQIDPSASSAQGLVMHGRTLEVVRALTREDAAMRKEDGEKSRQKADKRNTYLMREGVIFPNTPASRALPEAEVEKRTTSFSTRKKLLESNPALYISKTRLSIRQIPLYATDRTLKRLAIHAVREFDKEVESKDREGFSREEEMDDTKSPALEAKGNKSKRGERTTAVIQSKILRQTDRVDPLTSLGKSKGFGFLEMRSHKEALRVLRWANNNPEVGNLMREWAATELQELETKTKEKLDKARTEKDQDLEEMELKYKKLQAKVKEGQNGLVDQMKQGKTLLIEFSVENIQVVKRRVEKIGDAGNPNAGDRKRRSRPSENDSDVEAPEPSRRPKLEGQKAQFTARVKPETPVVTTGRPEKRRRTGDKKDGAPKEGEAEEKDKAGKGMGGLIGKKRKERKAKAGK